MKIYNNKMRRLRSVNLQIMMAKEKKRSGYWIRRWWSAFSVAFLDFFFLFFIHEFKSIQIEKEDFLVFNNEENPL